MRLNAVFRHIIPSVNRSAACHSNTFSCLFQIDQILGMGLLQLSCKFVSGLEPLSGCLLLKCMEMMISQEKSLVLRDEMVQVLKLDKCKGFTTMGLQVIAQSCRLSSTLICAFFVSRHWVIWFTTVSHQVHFSNKFGIHDGNIFFSRILIGQYASCCYHSETAT
jgi:hypothetical protein